MNGAEERPHVVQRMSVRRANGSGVCVITYHGSSKRPPFSRRRSSSTGQALSSNTCSDAITHHSAIGVQKDERVFPIVYSITSAIIVRKGCYSLTSPLAWGLADAELLNLDRLEPVADPAAAEGSRPDRS